MKPIFRITFLIWIRAIFFNALFIGIYIFLKEGFQGSVIFLVVLLVGFIVTAPLLILIHPIVRLSLKIPYSIRGRHWWLAFSLVVLVLAFYSFALFVIDRFFRWDDEFQLIVLAAIISVMIATGSVKLSYSKLGQIEPAKRINN